MKMYLKKGLLLKDLLNTQIYVLKMINLFFNLFKAGQSKSQQNKDEFIVMHQRIWTKKRKCNYWMERLNISSYYYRHDKEYNISSIEQQLSLNKTPQKILW